MSHFEDRPTRRVGDAPPDTRGTSRTGDPEVDELVTGIEETRGEMTVTVEAIGDRLDPSNLAAEARQTVRDATVGRVEQMTSQAGEVIEDAGRTAQQAGAGIVETIRQNPIPAALVGLGLGWLWKNRTSGNGGRYGGSGYRSPDWASYQARPMGRYEQQGWYEPRGWQGERYEERRGSGPMAAASGGFSGAADRLQQAGSDASRQAGDVAQQVQETAGDVAQQVQETAGQVAHQAQEWVGEAGYRARSLTEDIQYNAQRMIYDSPLAAGAIAVAVGAAIGAVLPATRREQEMIGPMSRDLMHQAEGMVQQAESAAEGQLKEMEQEAQQQD